jgi:hypothetical protein
LRQPAAIWPSARGRTRPAGGLHCQAGGGRHDRAGGSLEPGSGARHLAPGSREGEAPAGSQDLSPKPSLCCRGSRRPRSISRQPHVPNLRIAAEAPTGLAVRLAAGIWQSARGSTWQAHGQAATAHGKPEASTARRGAAGSTEPAGGTCQAAGGRREAAATRWRQTPRRASAPPR